MPIVISTCLSSSANLVIPYSSSVHLYKYMCRRYISFAPKISCIHLSKVLIHYIPFSTIVCDCFFLSKWRFPHIAPLHYFRRKNSFRFNFSSFVSQWLILMHSKHNNRPIKISSITTKLALFFWNRMLPICRAVLHRVWFIRAILSL